MEGAFRVLRAYTEAEQKPLTAAFRRMFAAGTDPLMDPAAAQAAGSIHVSPADQLTRVANEHYARLGEVVVGLALDRVGPEVVWEPAANGLDPHVYGPVNMDAVERAGRVRKQADGLYAIGAGEVAAFAAVRPDG